MLMTAMVVNAQTKSAVQEVHDYLHECGVFYIATVEGDQPRVRPFGVAEVLNGKLYIQTGKKKKVFKQMMANPKFEITAVKPSGMSGFASVASSSTTTAGRQRLMCLTRIRN